MKGMKHTPSQYIPSPPSHTHSHIDIYNIYRDPPPPSFSFIYLIVNQEGSTLVLSLEKGKPSWWQAVIKVCGCGCGGMGLGVGVCGRMRKGGCECVCVRSQSQKEQQCNMHQLTLTNPPDTAYKNQKKHPHTHNSKSSPPPKKTKKTNRATPRLTRAKWTRPPRSLTTMGRHRGRCGRLWCVCLLVCVGV
jgi:hypothetical protein